MRRYVKLARVASIGIAMSLAIGAEALEAQNDGETEITLDQAIRRALESNRDLEVARSQLTGSAGRVREAWSAVYPTINATGSYTRNLEVPGQFLPAQIFDPDAEAGELVLVRFGNDNSWFGSVRLEQPIFQASAFIGVGAAARFQELQEEIVRGRTQEVVTRTKQRYFDVLLAEEAVRLNEESVRRVEQALDETRAMRRAGLVGDYDVLRLEVELANLEPALRRAQNSAEAARRTLGVELALEDVSDLQVVGSLSPAVAESAMIGEGPEVVPVTVRALDADFGVDVSTQTTVQELVDLARSNRTDIRQTQLTEQLRRSELRAEQSEYLPQISFFATYGVSAQADGGINPFGWGSGRSVTSPQAGLQVTVPVFNGFQRPARVQQIRATLSQAEIQTRLVTAQVENQVETLLDQVDESRSRAEAQEVAVGQARRGYEIASAQFREGLGSRLELTDAEVALRQSEFNHAQAIHDYLTARAQLDQAVGRVPEAN